MADLQRTDEWHMARLGKVTASRIKDVLAETRSGAPSKMRDRYLAELALDRLTGQPREGYTNAAMQWGTDTEPQACAMYALTFGEMLEEVGFVPHPTIAQAGASPDRLVGDDGLVEVKCPESHTHMDTLVKGKVPSQYVHQMQWQMACTGREWCDFVSFDPRFPEPMQMFVHRVERDGEAIAAMEGAVKAFLVELDANLATLAERYPEQAVAA